MAKPTYKELLDSLVEVTFRLQAIRREFNEEQEGRDRVDTRRVLTGARQLLRQAGVDVD